MLQISRSRQAEGKRACLKFLESAGGAAAQPLS